MANWVDLAKDAESGIETIRAHFSGHAYDPHWHPQYLIGVTEQGHQQFHCRRRQVNSHQGHVFMLEPEELHDGHAPESAGFTYQMLYFDPAWLHTRMAGLYEKMPDGFEFSVASTLTQDPQLALRVSQAFQAYHFQEFRLIKETSIDLLLSSLIKTNWVQVVGQTSDHHPLIASKIRDMLYEHVCDEIGLDELAVEAGMDRFRMNRIFKSAYQIAPYQYLLQLRLSKARMMIAAGSPLADVASTFCFADQSHLGRWFRRCYGMTPATYQKICSG